jgi:hypothetical protein
MAPDRLARIESLYHATRARPAEERAAYLADACGTDEDLRREVELLLAQAEDGQLTSVVTGGRPAPSGTCRPSRSPARTSIRGATSSPLTWSSTKCDGQTGLRGRDTRGDDERDRQS